MKIKVLIITSAISPDGGTVGKIRKLVTHSEQVEYSIYFACSQENIIRAREEDTFYRKNGITTYYGDLGRNIFRFSWAIQNIVKKEKINIVHFYFNAEHTFVFCLKLLCPKTIYVRSFVGYIPLNSFKKCLMSLAIRLVENYIYISQYIKEKYENDFPLLKSKNSSIIYNCPVNVTKAENDEKRSLILYVGGINIHKNVPLLIEMMRVVVHFLERRDIVLTIIGDGPLRSEIENLINKYDLKNNVLLLGYKTNIVDYFSHTRIYLHPATNEGFGISVVEAMFMKCPCIVAKASALPELLNQDCGYILSPTDAEAWARHLVFLVDNPVLCGKMGAHASKRAKQMFSEKAFVSNHERFYQSLFKSNSK